MIDKGCRGERPLWAFRAGFGVQHYRVGVWDLYPFLVSWYCCCLLHSCIVLFSSPYPSPWGFAFLQCLNPSAILNWQGHPSICVWGSWRKSSQEQSPRVPGTASLRRRYAENPKGYWWVFDVADIETEDNKQLLILSDHSEAPSVSVKVSVQLLSDS